MRYLRKDDPLLVIIGPSGTGKSTVVQELEKLGIVEVAPSWTTRPPRKEEIGISVEHAFVSEEEFLRHQKDGFFLEAVQLFNLPYLYGLPKIAVPGAGRVPTIMLRAGVLKLLPKHYSNVVIYQIEDDYKRVKERLAKRTEDGENQGSRLEEYDKELSLGRESAKRIFTNDKDISSLVADLAKAIEKDFSKK